MNDQRYGRPHNFFQEIQKIICWGREEEPDFNRNHDQVEYIPSQIPYSLNIKAVSKYKSRLGFFFIERIIEVTVTQCINYKKILLNLDQPWPSPSLKTPMINGDSFTSKAK